MNFFQNFIRALARDTPAYSTAVPSLAAAYRRLVRLFGEFWYE